MQIFDMFTQSCCQRHLHLFLKFNSSTMKTRLLGTLFLNTNLMARVPSPRTQPPTPITTPANSHTRMPRAYPKRYLPAVCGVVCFLFYVISRILKQNKWQILLYYWNFIKMRFLRVSQGLTLGNFRSQKSRKNKIRGLLT